MDLHHRAKDLFLEARKLPEAERTAWLEEACGGDAAMREEVESLLAAAEMPTRYVAPTGNVVSPRSPASDGETLKVEMSEVQIDAEFDAQTFAEDPVPPEIGRFKITGQLGRGGMGVVYAGFDPELRRPVAVKLLVARGADTQARLRREARTMARISHPNVASVHDFGEHDGRLFIAMEFVEGQTLDAWLTHTRPRLWQLLDVFVQAGGGLAAAHADGVVHRDFKPGNVIVARDGRVRVLDFGLARTTALPRDERGYLTTTLEAQGSVTENLTQGGIAGTPAYMAPEHLRGQAVTEKSDQFAFSVSLFEALYGVRPYDGATFADLAAAVLTGKRRKVDEEGEPAWLRSLIDKGMSTRADDRFESMDALLAALDGGRLEGGLGRILPRRSRLGRNLPAGLLVLVCVLIGFGVGLAEVPAIPVGLGVMAVGAATLLAALYRRGSLARFGAPRSTRRLRSSVPADRVLELLVRNAGRFDYVVDEQDWGARQLCLRVRAGFRSVGAYLRVEVDNGDPTTVVIGQRPILPVWGDPLWRRPTEEVVDRIAGLLGDDRTYPPMPAI